MVYLDVGKRLCIPESFRSIGACGVGSGLSHGVGDLAKPAHQNLTNFVAKPAFPELFCIYSLTQTDLQKSMRHHLSNALIWS
jgi:hypothetical protein